jgi:hypothetical protein
LSDLAVSLIVIGGTGILLVFVFWLSAKSKRTKDKLLSDYCQSHGYSLSKKTGPLQTELRIEGKGFTLLSSMLSRRQETQTGSSSWEKQTLWKTLEAHQAWPTFVLGSVPTASNWNRLPDYVQNAAVAKLSQDFGFVCDAQKAQPLRIDGGPAFLLFEETQGESAAAIERLKPLLTDVQNQIVIQSSPEQISIRISGCFIRDAAAADRLIRLGFACMGQTERQEADASGQWEETGGQK